MNRTDGMDVVKRYGLAFRRGSTATTCFLSGARLALGSLSDPWGCRLGGLPRSLNFSRAPMLHVNEPRVGRSARRPQTAALFLSLLCWMYCFFSSPDGSNMVLPTTVVASAFQNPDEAPIDAVAHSRHQIRNVRANTPLPMYEFATSLITSSP